MLFFEETPPIFTKTIYNLRQDPQENASSENIENGKLHTMQFQLKERVGNMVVDNLPESRGTFSFQNLSAGYFSLASTGTATRPGAFAGIRLVQAGEVLLDIDFENLRSVDELDAYFDCYSFSALQPFEQGKQAPIRTCWELNSRGHLHCIQKRSTSEISAKMDPLCLLTFRRCPVSDFEVTLRFEQAWERYGITFGCKHGQIPYHYDRRLQQTVFENGGFAFIGGQGSRNLCGAITETGPRSLVNFFSYDKPL